MAQGSNNAIDLLKVLGPMFLGGGKTTTKQSSSADPQALAALRGVGTRAQSNARDPARTQPIIDSIIRRNARAFAPVVAQQNQSGLYRSTTLQQLAAEQEAETAGETSKAVLDYQTQQDQIASRAFGDILANTRGMTQTQAVAPAVSPAISGGIGAATLGYSAYKNWDDIVGAKDTVLDLVGMGPQAARVADTVSTFSDAGQAADVVEGLASFSDFGGAASGAVDVASAVSDGVGLVSDASGALETVDYLDDLGGIMDVGSSFADVGDAVDVASSASDVMSGIDMFSGGPSPLSFASAAMNIAEGDYLGAALSFIPGGNIVKDLFSGDLSIICTELHKQGKLSRRQWIAGLRHFSKYGWASREAYYLWATPTVAHIKKYPEGKIAKFMLWLFSNRSRFIMKELDFHSVVAYAIVSSFTTIRGLLSPIPFIWLRDKFYKGVTANG